MSVGFSDCQDPDPHSSSSFGQSSICPGLVAGAGGSDVHNLLGPLGEVSPPQGRSLDSALLGSGLCGSLSHDSGVFPVEGRSWMVADFVKTRDWSFSDSSEASGGDDPCQYFGLGSLVRVDGSLRLMVPPRSEQVFELARVGGSETGSSIFRAPVEGVGCLGSDGQHCGKVLCQQAGRHEGRFPESDCCPDFSWAQDCLLSLSAVHIEGVVNTRADLLSRGIPSSRHFFSPPVGVSVPG